MSEGVQRLRHYALLIFLVLSASLWAASDPSPAGLWRTVDDKTHKPRGTVRIHEHDGAFFGTIESSFNPEENAAVCLKCEGDRKGKPVIGMVILRDMKKRGEVYEGGDILDPDTGTVYRCKMWLEEGGRKLVVRGFIGFSLIGRSQTWSREE